MTENKLDEFLIDEDDGKDVSRKDLEKILAETLKQADSGKNFLSNKRAEVAQNNRLDSGDHWYGLAEGNKAEKPMINVTNRIGSFKVSSVMSEKIAGVFSVKGVKENSPNAEKYQKGADLYTKLAKSTDKRLDSMTIDERMLKRSWIAGKALVHYLWDDTIEGGNDVLEKGDFIAETVHSINWYPSDVNNPNIQTQDYNILAMRRTRKWVTDFAKANGRTEEELKLIKADNDTDQAAFDEAQHELDDSENLWVYAKYWRENGKIWAVIVVQGLVLKHPWNTKLDDYPIVGMDWLEEEESAYGRSEITSLKWNQFAINKVLANACIAVTKSAHPIMIYNRDLMMRPTGKPGTAFGVQGSVQDAFKFAQPGQLSFDIWRFLESLISWTKEMAGATETALGEVKPENTSALLANQAQAAVPIASIVRRYKQYKIDTYRVYCDFYRNYYDMERLVTYENEEGEDVSEAYTGTDYQDVKFSVELDVGAASQYSEVIQTNMLNNLLNADRINFIEFLERIGDTIPKKQELIDTRREQLEAQQQAQATRQQFKQQLSPQDLAMFEQLTPEQQEQIFAQGGV